MFDGEVGSLNKRKVSLRGKSGREGSAKDTVCVCVLCTTLCWTTLPSAWFFFFLSLS